MHKKVAGRLIQKNPIICKQELPVSVSYLSASSLQPFTPCSSCRLCFSSTLREILTSHNKTEGQQQLGTFAHSSFRRDLDKVVSARPNRTIKQRRNQTYSTNEITDLYIQDFVFCSCLLLVAVEATEKQFFVPTVWWRKLFAYSLPICCFMNPSRCFLQILTTNAHVHASWKDVVFVAIAWNDKSATNMEIIFDIILVVTIFIRYPQKPIDKLYFITVQSFFHPMTRREFVLIEKQNKRVPAQIGLECHKRCK